MTFFGFGYPFLLLILIRSQKQKDSQKTNKLKENLSRYLTQNYNSSHSNSNNMLFIKRNDHLKKIIANEPKNLGFSNSDSKETKNKNLKEIKVIEENNQILFFFYKEYKDECYFWETVIFLQKFLLTLIPNLNYFIAEETKDLLFVNILFVYLAVVFKIFPFKRNFINWLEINSVITNILTRLCFVVSQSLYINGNIKTSLLAFQFILNIAFFIHMILIIVKYTDWKGYYKKSVQTMGKMITTLQKASSSLSQLKKKNSIRS